MIPVPNLFAMMLLAMLFMIASGAQGQSQSNVSIALSTWQPGIASLYGTNAGTPGFDEYGTTIGSCGYANIPYTTWPFRSVAALPTTGQGYLAGPMQGCGSCYQITCVDDGPEFAGKCNLNSDQESVTVQVNLSYTSSQSWK